MINWLQPWKKLSARPFLAIGVGFLALSLITMLPFVLSMQQAQNRQRQHLNKERESQWIAYCKSARESGSGNQEECAKYRDQVDALILQAQQAEGKERAKMASLRSANISDKCMTYIGKLMRRPKDIMKSTYISPDLTSALVTYMQDGTMWAYECKTDGNTIVWRMIETGAAGAGSPGRWREEDRTPISSL